VRHPILSRSAASYPRSPAQAKRQNGRRATRRRREREEPAEPQEDLVTLDAALTKRTEHDKQSAELAQLRYFAGLPIRDIAEVMIISSGADDQLWRSGVGRMLTPRTAQCSASSSASSSD
jgi:DNA-directed RNA polymerase specialized sigma24 family protein